MFHQLISRGKLRGRGDLSPIHLAFYKSWGRLDQGGEKRDHV